MVFIAWFIQQKPFGYVPLRAGLGLITNDELREFPPSLEMLCKKIYTTRTHRLSGEYVVVEGSRFKAKPVVPEIRFKVSKVADLNLHGVVFFPPGNEFDFSWKTFAEQDLGYCGATFEQLRDELLRLNKKATIETPFYINRLEPAKSNNTASATTPEEV